MNTKWNNEEINKLKEKNQITNFGIFSNDLNDENKIKEHLSNYDGMISEGFVDNPEIFNFNINDNLTYISIIKEYGGFFNKNDMLINLISNLTDPNDYLSVAGAIDGAFIIVDAVYGVDITHEKALYTYLTNGIIPILIINNVNRLIIELNLTPEDMQNRFLYIFMEMNRIILNISHDESYRLDFTDGSVAFGALSENWLINVPTMQDTGINFADIIQYCNMNRENELSSRIPVDKTLIEMALNHFSNLSKKSEPPFKDINNKSMLNLNQNSVRPNFCPSCGAKIEGQYKFCINCGNPIQ